MKKFVVFSYIVALLSGVCFAWAQEDSLPPTFSPIIYHDYQISNQKDSLNYIFTIQKDDTIVFTGRYFNPNFVKIINFQSYPSQKPIYLRDINNDGVEELIWEEYTGGAHCCTNWWIFSLGDKFKKLAKLEALDGSFQLLDVDNDQVWEIQTQDYCLIYWNGLTLANMDAPEVILSWQNGQYLPDKTKMSKPVDVEKLRKEAAALRLQTEQNLIGSNLSSADSINPSNYLESQIWMQMVQLIYSNNRKWAYQFLDWALADLLKPYRKKIILELETKLKDCPYFPRKHNKKPVQKVY